MATALMLSSLEHSRGGIYRTISDEPKKSDQEKLIIYYKLKGLKEFNIDGIIVWARNYKNAKRKAKNGNVQNRKVH